MSATDFVPLGAGRWRAWRGAVLRGAGFGVDRVDVLADERLATAADAVNAGGAEPAFADAFADACERLAKAVATVAADPGVREAVTWQNRAFVPTCLDRIRPDQPRRSASRAREVAVAGYLQRYTTKNDSIGFFGPVGWADWDPAIAGIVLRPGPGLVRTRTVRLESWAVDALAAALATRPEVAAAIAPRRVAAHRIDGTLARLVGGGEIRLSDEAAAVLALCDGVRDVASVAAALGCSTTEVGDRLDELARHDLVRVDLYGPAEAAALARLRDRLLAMPAASRAVADLDELEEARAAVARAAGDPDALGAALEALDTTFEVLTGQPAVRDHGQTYAARTVVYEDTVRDVEVRLGGDMLAELGRPLDLVLDSARWLACRIAHDYLRVLGRNHDRLARRTGRAGVPLAALLAPVTQDLRRRRGGGEATREAVAELQRRWAGLLAMPPGARHHDVDPEAIAGGVAAAFASPPPPWAAGLRHSPDVMIAAASADAISRGEYRYVLGELHLTHNSIEAAALADQHPDPARLAAMAAATVGDGRVAPVAPREWGIATRLTAPPWLLSEGTRHIALGGDDVAHVPGGVLPGGGLTVHRMGDALLVRDPDGRMFPLVEVVGQHLTSVAVDAFAILAPGSHTPRVTIGRLVVARETWRLQAQAAEWARQSDERHRYLRMRAWAAEHGLPRRAFYRLPTEPKPTYVDFTSLPLTNRLASGLRRLAGTGGEVVFSEMLPDVTDCWLTDAAGTRYTSELRMVVTERDVINGR